MDQATTVSCRISSPRKSRSLLLYIGDAFPWTTSAHCPDLVTLGQLMATSRLP